ncbi:hypothetical protein [Calothrix sp. 336/3]|uniref:hypothetical protein n=1 Tax=Calothrix sp. 336/3 TaxID=1337936 RepID=UPI0004E33558|nr:hypothetical protein [Calothrix sp. 336/3]AKG20717.1 hypothetical protein IJ00_04800 [Calothrix sp. 336/3]
MNTSLCHKLLTVTATVAIAWGTSPWQFSLPAAAQPEPNPASPASSRCRVTSVSTSVYREAATTSSVVSVVPKDTRVTLSYIPDGEDRFVRIQSPAIGFIQTAVLKPCGSQPNPNPNPKPWQKPTVGRTCRLVIRPSQGLNIRKEPNEKAAYIATVYPDTELTVNLTTGNVVKTYKDQKYVWIEIDLSRTFRGENFSGNGWIVNTNLVTAPKLSNVAYCD